MDKNIEMVYKYYQNYDEDSRIMQDQAHHIEYILTMDVLNEIFSYFKQKKPVVADIGCGTGNYSIELANASSIVYACDIMQKYLDTLTLKMKRKKIDNIITNCCNAECLFDISDSSCDITLCMGPLYHLYDEKSRFQCLSELKRITKINGYIIISYLNPKALWANIARGKITLYDFEQLEAQEQVFIPPFVFRSPSRIIEELSSHSLRIINHYAIDTFSSFMIETINSWSKDEFDIWLKLVRRHMEDPSWIDFSSHGLIVAKANH